MDERPHSKDPSFGSEVSFLNDGIGSYAKLRVDIAGGEEDVGHNVGYFEEEVVVPSHLEDGLLALDKAC